MSNVVFPSAVRGLAYAVTRSYDFSTIVQSAPNKAEIRIQQIRNPVWRWELIYEFLKDNPNDIVSGLTYTDLRTLVGFGLARGGQADDFLFTDPDDNAVTNQQLSLVNDGVGNYYSPVQRDFGGFLEDITDLNGSITVWANAALQTGTYTVGGPGLALPGSSYMGLYVKWNSPAAWQASHSYALNATILDSAGHLQKVTTAGTSGSSAPTWNDSGSTTTDGSVTWTDQGYNPGPATPITASFNFYFRVRFASDQMPLDKWANQWWTAGGPDAQNSEAIKLVSSRSVSV